MPQVQPKKEKKKKTTLAYVVLEVGITRWG